MKKIIKTLETIGQTSSIKQFTSIIEMKDSLGINDTILEKIEKVQSDLVCLVEPGDDD